LGFLVAFVENVFAFIGSVGMARTGAAGESGDVGGLVATVFAVVV